MIERALVAQKIKEFQIEEFISKNLKRVGHSHTRLQRTPLGEKIIIYASRPGLIVGKKGQNVKKLTASLKKEFGLENPQIEIAEIDQINLNPQIIAEKIANSLERYGTQRFKGVGHKSMEEVMNAGALGVEILISGKIPSSRAKRWRFYSGYLKKCGDISLTGVDQSTTHAHLKTGTIGINVKIMPPGTKLPDKVTFLGEVEEKIEEVTEEAQEEKKETEKTSKKDQKEKASDKKE